MNVKEVRELARQWVEAEADKIPGFSGAFLHGSINQLADDMVWPASSDVDIALVVTGVDSGQQDRHRTTYKGLLLDPSFKNMDELQSAEQVLGTYYLACHFVTPTSILADPTGHLTRLQPKVAASYTKRRWIRQRCEQAKQLAESSNRDMIGPNPCEERHIYLLLTLIYSAQILALADLRNPTFRKSLVSAQEILTVGGQAGLHEALLKLLGNANMSRTEAAEHCQELTEAFDRAVMLLRTPCWDDYMVTAISRPNFIDSSWELINSGFHREAMIWMLLIRTVCQRVFENDASANEKAAFRVRYGNMLHALGLNSLLDFQQRAKQVRMVLPEVMRKAEIMMSRNPRIKD